MGDMDWMDFDPLEVIDSYVISALVGIGTFVDEFSDVAGAFNLETENNATVY